MAAYLPYEASVHNASNFIMNTREYRNLYFGLGKNTIWGTPDNPPAILGNYQEKIDFWDNIVSNIRRIDKRDIFPIVPRITWQNGDTYVVFDVDGEFPYDDKFYVINSNDEVFSVNTVGLGASTVEPLLSNVATGTGIVTTSDGYLWRYEYTTNSYELDLAGADWIPVDFFDTINTDDDEINLDSHIRLGCRYVMVHGVADDTLFIDDYRQIGLMVNPRLVADDSIVATTDATIGSVTPYSGNLIYLENLAVQNISAGQYTDIKIILRF